MNIELDQEVDGRWIASLTEPPYRAACHVYGDTPQQAVHNLLIVWDDASGNSFGTWATRWKFAARLFRAKERITLAANKSVFRRLDRALTLIEMGLSGELAPRQALAEARIAINEGVERLHRAVGE